MAFDWGVFVDAYLFNGARVGDRFAAKAYFSQPGTIQNGMTVATLPVEEVAIRGAYKLLRTLDGADHYVLVSEQIIGEHDGNGD